MIPGTTISSDARSQMFRSIGMAALLLCCLTNVTHAEPKLRLMIGNCFNQSSSKKTSLDHEVADAVRSELGRSAGYGADQYITIPVAEFEKAQGQLPEKDRETVDGLRGIRSAILARLASTLKADIIVHSWYRVNFQRPARNSVTVGIVFTHITTGDIVMYAVTTSVATSIERAVVIAVADSVHKCRERHIPIVGIRQRIGKTVILPIGLAAGIVVADEFIVIREVNGTQERIGTVRVRKVSTDETEADVFTEVSLMSPGDLCVHIVRLPFPGCVLPMTR